MGCCKQDGSLPMGAAENKCNISIVNCTTPANYFHVLRRQIYRNFRKPLIVMSPKSLLRHKSCVSSFAEFDVDSRFHRVLGETHTDLVADDKVRRILFCTGKIYYELEHERDVVVKAGRAKGLVSYTYFIVCFEVHPPPMVG